MWEKKYTETQEDFLLGPKKNCWISFYIREIEVLSTVVLMIQAFQESEYTSVDMM
jgi:hypothetical protein